MRKLILVLLFSLISFMASSEDTEDIISYVDAFGNEIVFTDGFAEIDIDSSEMVTDRFLGAIILSEDEVRTLFISDNIAGTREAAEDGAVLRITYGEYMLDGMLTIDGAIAVICLYRTGIVIDEIELDYDDGLTIYEGECYLDNIEYEFEIDAHTGKLIEWDRD